MVMIIIQFDLHFEAGTVPLIPILEIKDPGHHGPLILKPMFVGIFEQVVVLSELDNQFPFPSVSQFLSAFSGQPFQLHLQLQMIAGLSLSTTDETAANEALSSFCLSDGRSEV